MVATIERNGAAKSEATNGKLSVSIPAMKEETFSVKLVGTSPLIVNKFSNKAKQAMEDKQQKKAKQARPKREPEQEYLAACYVMPGSKQAGEKGALYGIPAAGIKNAAVTATRYVEGMTATFARGAFFVMDDGGGLVQIEYSEMRMREDAVRLASPSRPLDLRYRPEFLDWSCDVRIRYNASAITPEQIINLFNVAGFSVGLCEWRAEKNGQNGGFRIETSTAQSSARRKSR
jgi:hypothetical protein